ncbi:hypothetical protein QOZ89_38635 [Pseudofrankia sp. BMG5.37]|uniref:hypothetical protein n=1 Tax=Pseudofrankia sp. BMG5.36 TaxID=1834512 RepID=UPI000AD66CD6|nr:MULTISPECIES: hypothetical protein [unclassified Pseudofrankia]MDT3445471.1 hypothetical protein [Pseudofrankia sp. BMG5.37]
MRATIALGRIAGVRVGVHWSVLLIFGIITFGLAQDRLPQAYPGRALVLYWVAPLAPRLPSSSPCSPTRWRTP